MVTLQELQEQIGAWHFETFGECSNKRIARKLLEEAAETMAACSPLAGDKELGYELADCLIAICALAHRNGINLMSHTVSKFGVVKQRDITERSK